MKLLENITNLLVVLLIGVVIAYFFSDSDSKLRENIVYFSQKIVDWIQNWIVNYKK